jgi:hypothetical protein
MEHPKELFKQFNSDEHHCIPFTIREFEKALIRCGFPQKDAKIVVVGMKDAYDLCVEKSTV